MENSVVIAGVGEGMAEEGMEGDKRWWTEMWLGEVYMDDVLWSCVPETCIILLTNVTPMNAIKRKRLQWRKENAILIIKFDLQQLIKSTKSIYRNQSEIEF